VTLKLAITGDLKGVAAYPLVEGRNDKIPSAEGEYNPYIKNIGDRK